MTWGQMAVGITSAVLVFLGTWAASRFSAKVGHQANRTADWDGFTSKLERDNDNLRARMEKVENKLEELRREVRDRDRRIDDLTEEVEAQAEEIADFHTYTAQLRAELQRRDPSLRLPEPPPRIARHFCPTD